MYLSTSKNIYCVRNMPTPAPLKIFLKLLSRKDKLSRHSRFRSFYTTTFVTLRRKLRRFYTYVLQCGKLSRFIYAN